MIIGIIKVKYKCYCLCLFVKFLNTWCKLRHFIKYPTAIQLWSYKLEGVFTSGLKSSVEASHLYIIPGVRNDTNW